MKLGELRAHLRNLADHRCQTKHPEVYNQLNRVGPGSKEKGHGPPCTKCLADIEHEYRLKEAKAHGHRLTPREAEKLRKELRIR